MSHHSLEAEARIPQVESICRLYYDYKVLKTTYLGGGSYGFAYLVEMESIPEVVVKGYRVEGMHETEKFQLDLLRQNTSVKIPEVYQVFNHNETIPFDAIIMEYLEGVDAFTTPSLLLKSAKTRKMFANQVINGLMEIHQAKNPTFGYVTNPTYPTWQSFYITIVDQVWLGALHLFQEKKLKRKYLRLMQSCQECFNQVFDETILEATLTHGDLNVMNMLVNPSTLKLVGFIDPFNSMWADRDYDLFQLNNLTGKRFFLYKTYHEKTTLSPKTPLKCAYYAYVNELLCYILSGWTWEPLLNSVYIRLKKELKNAGLTQLSEL